VEAPPRTSFDRLEAAWDELRHAVEDRVVARHRGLPVAEAGYAERWTGFVAAFAAVDPSSLADAERRGLACMGSAAGFLASLEPPPDLDLSAVVAAAGAAAPEPAAIAALRSATYEAYGEAAEHVVLPGGETIDRLTAFDRLATVADPAERRAVFDALEPVWRAVDGDGRTTSPYRQLTAASAERWAVSGSVIEANAAAMGLAPGALEPMLWRILGAGREVVAAAASVRGGRRVEPWEYRYVVGAAERHLRETLPLERLRPINDAHLRSLGADPEALAIGYDIVPRPDRPPIPVAFTIGGRPGPWVFANYREGGLGNLAELLHESGHAIHVAAIDTRPAFAEPPETDAAFFEAIADVVGWDADEPAFQERHLGRGAEPVDAVVSRYGAVLLDICWSLFEIEVHRSLGRRANDVWAEIVADGLGIEPHPEWSWWAVRGQLIEAPGYLANYALSAIAAAALRARIRELRGDWSDGDPGWYPFVADHLLRFGGERTPAELIAAFLGGPLTETPLLEDLGRAGGRAEGRAGGRAPSPASSPARRTT